MSGTKKINKSYIADAPPTGYKKDLHSTKQGSKRCFKKGRRAMSPTLEIVILPQRIVYEVLRYYLEHKKSFMPREYLFDIVRTVSGGNTKSVLPRQSVDSTSMTKDTQEATGHRRREVSGVFIGGSLRQNEGNVVVITITYDQLVNMVRELGSQLHKIRVNINRKRQVVTAGLWHHFLKHNAEYIASGLFTYLGCEGKEGDGGATEKPGSIGLKWGPGSLDRAGPYIGEIPSRPYPGSHIFLSSSGFITLVWWHLIHMSLTSYTEQLDFVELDKIHMSATTDFWFGAVVDTSKGNTEYSFVSRLRLNIADIIRVMWPKELFRNPRYVGPDRHRFFLNKYQFVLGVGCLV